MDESDLSARLAAIEAQILALSQHLGVPCPQFVSTMFRTPAPPMPGMAPAPAPYGAPPQTPAYQLEVAALVRAGNKIEAIKVFREATGCSLLEAKDAVERIV